MTLVIDLKALNQSVHEEVNELEIAFLEALTALQLDEAGARFESLRDKLLAHLRFEDAEVVPVLRQVCAQHAPDDGRPLRSLLLLARCPGQFY